MSRHNWLCSLLALLAEDSQFCYPTYYRLCGLPISPLVWARGGIPTLCRERTRNDSAGTLLGVYLPEQIYPARPVCAYKEVV